jgi:hypothetical protein
VELSGSPVTAYTRVSQAVLRNFFPRFFCFRFFAQPPREMRLREYEANQGKRIGTPARPPSYASVQRARCPLRFMDFRINLPKSRDLRLSGMDGG